MENMKSGKSRTDKEDETPSGQVRRVRARGGSYIHLWKEAVIACEKMGARDLFHWMRLGSRNAKERKGLEKKGLFESREPVRNSRTTWERRRFNSPVKIPLQKTTQQR